MPFYNVMALTIKATAALTAKRAVTGAGAVPAAAARCVGFARNDAAIGDNVTVDVLGVVEAEAGAAIAVNVPVELDSSGRVVTKSSGVTVGYMAPGQAAAGAAGDVVEIVQIPN